MKKTFKISPTEEIIVNEAKMKMLQSRFADLDDYAISESQQIAYLELVCNLLGRSLKHSLPDISTILGKKEILISELMKMVTSLPLLQFKIIDGYYGFFGCQKSLQKLADELEKPIEVIEFQKNEIIKEFSMNTNFLVTERIKSLQEEINRLTILKKQK